MMKFHLAFILFVLALTILKTESASELKPSKPYCKNKGPMMPLAFISELSCLRKCSDWCCSQRTCWGQREGMCVGTCEKQYWKSNPEMAEEKGLERKLPSTWWSCCCKRCSRKFVTPIG